MSKWSTTSETGILRKPKIKDKFDDLLVFGYACKLFRDDEKALYIDQGKHLIPWMGDSVVKIDRYDCRGALSELTQHEGCDRDASRWYGLSDSDRRIEMLCDEERYYALKNNEEELEMYQEEETKRLQQQNVEFQYNYDVPRNPDEPEEVIDVPEVDEEFVPPTELNIPADMEVPKTVKENSRIEKTAVFISSQGPQMEILIKTKQADNPQFFFMNKDNPLYKYYKHLLSAIKSGQYKTKSNEASSDQKSEDTNEQEDFDGHYLHPSLLATSVQPAQSPPPPLPPPPTVTYKPSADCAYSQLVNRIQGTQTETLTDTTSQMTYEQQQYYQQYYYAAQYYEYYKQLTQQFAGQNSDQTQAIQDPTFTQEQFYALCQKQAELQNHTAYQQYADQPINPYVQLVTNLSQTQTSNLNDIAKAPILYTKSESPPLSIIGPQLPVKTQDPELQLPNVSGPTLKPPLLSLADYGTDSEDESEDDDIKKPPSDLQQIIDKMAVYVSKNGRDFENIVRSKGDIRFQFLNVGHEYNKYYKMKLDESTKSVQENGIVVEKTKEKKVVAPVSFSIKKPKDELPKEIKSALPVEESDEESENVETADISLTPPLKEALIVPVENGYKDDCVMEKTNVSNDVIPLEMIDIPDDLQERRENKRVENSKMDKITAAAKGRLALQLERKKKAAAFLKLQTSSPLHTETLTLSENKTNDDQQATKNGTSEIEVINIDDSDLEEGEIKKRKKSSSSKKKKSHKRKRSKSRRESKKCRHRHKSKDHKKSKKRRKRSETSDSDSSVVSS